MQKIGLFDNKTTKLLKHAYNELYKAVMEWVTEAFGCPAFSYLTQKTIEGLDKNKKAQKIMTGLKSALERGQGIIFKHERVTSFDVYSELITTPKWNLRIRNFLKDEACKIDGMRTFMISSKQLKQIKELTFQEFKRFLHNIICSNIKDYGDLWDSVRTRARHNSTLGPMLEEFPLFNDWMAAAELFRDPKFNSQIVNILKNPVGSGVYRGRRVCTIAKVIIEDVKRMSGTYRRYDKQPLLSNGSAYSSINLSANPSKPVVVVITVPHASCKNLKVRNCDKIGGRSANCIETHMNQVRGNKKIITSVFRNDSVSRMDCDMNRIQCRNTKWRKGITEYFNQVKKQMLIHYDIHSFPPEMDGLTAGQSIYFIVKDISVSLAKQLMNYIWMNMTIHDPKFRGLIFLGISNDIQDEIVGMGMQRSILIEFNENIRDDRLKEFCELIAKWTVGRVRTVVENK